MRLFPAPMQPRRPAARSPQRSGAPNPTSLAPTMPARVLPMTGGARTCPANQGLRAAVETDGEGNGEGPPNKQRIRMPEGCK